jgi:hypothetical protein
VSGTTGWKKHSRLEGGEGQRKKESSIHSI